jgi:hypothetical protein
VRIRVLPGKFRRAIAYAAIAARKTAISVEMIPMPSELSSALVKMSCSKIVS